MSAALIAALVFAVALLVNHAYFLLGSVPLLVLKHDTPMDARFVRGFFNIYYVAALYTASATAVSLAFAGRPLLAAGAGALALLAIVLRRTVITRMDSIRSELEMEDPSAIPAFRRMHVTAVLISLAQLVFIVGSLIVSSMQQSAAA